MSRLTDAALLLATLSVVGGFAPAHVESQQSPIDKALRAVPERAREATTVIRWNADHSYEVLREGDGPLVCYDRSDEARRASFDVQCTSMGNLERVAQSRRFRAESTDREAEEARIQAADERRTGVAFLSDEFEDGFETEMGPFGAFGPGVGNGRQAVAFRIGHDVVTERFSGDAESGFGLVIESAGH